MRTEFARFESEFTRKLASLATETAGQALGEIHVGLRREFQKELEVATGKLGIDLREVNAGLRTEFARLESKVTQRLANLAAETAGFHLRGAYQSDQDYARYDVVTLDGSSYVARQDNPGLCPGDGWRTLASAGCAGAQGIRSAKGEQGNPGSPGPVGARGPQGKPGAPGPSITGWRIDPASYSALPIMSDGNQGPPLELRALFQQLLDD